jgi:hypothetical protein
MIGPLVLVTMIFLLLFPLVAVAIYSKLDRIGDACTRIAEALERETPPPPPSEPPKPKEQVPFTYLDLK